LLLGQGHLICQSLQQFKTKKNQACTLLKMISKFDYVIQTFKRKIKPEPVAHQEL